MALTKRVVGKLVILILVIAISGAALGSVHHLWYGREFEARAWQADAKGADGRRFAMASSLLRRIKAERWTVERLLRETGAPQTRTISDSIHDDYERAILDIGYDPATRWCGGEPHFLMVWFDDGVATQAEIRWLEHRLGSERYDLSKVSYTLDEVLRLRARREEKEHQRLGAR